MNAKQPHIKQQEKLGKNLQNAFFIRWEKYSYFLFLAGIVKGCEL